MLSVVRLNALMPSVVMLNVDLLNIVMLSHYAQCCYAVIYEC